MSVVKLKIDIKGGTLDVEADDENFQEVMKEAGVLLDKFAKAQISSDPVSKLVNNHDVPTGTKQDSEQPSKTEASSAKPRRRRTSGGGKTANWQFLNDLLTPEQGEELRKFYRSKSPANQNEQVAVLVIKMKELLDQEAFDGNEVYTAFRNVDVKAPANLAAVFGNMTGLNYGSQIDKKFIPNWKCEQLVVHDLPRKGDDT